MISFLEKIISTLPSKVIYRGDGKKYLTRYYLFKKPKPWLPSIYIHCFHASDEDYELHSHPWNFSLSLILKGSYLEHFRVQDHCLSRLLSSGNYNFITEGKYHKIELITNEVWTLFVSGQKVSDWGFWHPKTKKYTPWKEFVEEKRYARLDSAAE